MILDEIYNEYNTLYKNSILPYIKCKKCGYKFYYPRNICPECGSDDLKIEKSSGTGEIYSYTLINNNAWSIISMDDGFRLYININGKNPEIGKKIKIIFIDNIPEAELL
jgi:uncharacterized OB-fold protein